jgi:hypothetical protein
MQDDLEVHLRGLKPRSVPPSWRRDILAACAERQEETWFQSVARFLYPGPLPTAALALLWLVILGFFLDTPPEPSAPLRLDVASVRAAQAERRTLLAQLNELESDRQRGPVFAAPLRTEGIQR